jgi:hypothetical protein
MVTESFAIFALGAMTVDLPELAHFTSGPPIAGAASLVMHGDFLLPAA